MAIARDATSSGSGTGTSFTIAHTTSGADRVLFVLVHETAGLATTTNISSVTYGGVGMTKLVEHYRTFSTGFVTSIWFLAAPTTGANNIVVTVALSDTLDIFGVSYTGASQTAPTGTALKQFSSNSADLLMQPVSIADDSWAVSIGLPLDSGITNGTNYVSLGYTNGIFADSNAGMGTAGTETIACTQSSTPGSRWGGCCTAAFAPAAVVAAPKNLSLLGVGA